MFHPLLNAAPHSQRRGKLQVPFQLCAGLGVSDWKILLIIFTHYDPHNCTAVTQCSHDQFASRTYK